MIQILISLIALCTLPSCKENSVEFPADVVSIDKGDFTLPDDIGQWPGILYRFRDNTGMEVLALDEISMSSGVDFSSGDQITLVTFDKQDFISADSAVGLPSDKYAVRADLVGEHMPRVWSGSSVAADDADIMVSLAPVTSEVKVSVMNVPESYKGTLVNIDGFVNDVFYPSTGDFASYKHNSLSVGVDEGNISFNIFPMDEDVAAWPLSFCFEFEDRTCHDTQYIGRRIGRGEHIEITVDMAKVETDGYAEFSYSSTDILSGDRYEFARSIVMLTEEEREISESNRHYSVFVRSDGRWVPVRVYDALCSDAEKHGSIWNDWGNDRKLRDTMSYCIFEHQFDGPVSVRVQKKDAAFSDARVRPSIWNIDARVSAEGMVEFQLPSYERRKVSVEFDGDRQHNLFLIPHRPDTDKPDPSDPDVIYFGPGEHDRDAIRLTDGQTLYIDYGAVLYSTIVVEGDGCTIAGHGILSGDKLRHWGGESWSNGEIIFKCNPSRSYQRSGLTVKDISIINGPSWNLSVWNFDNVVIDGVNIIDWGLNGDGIDLICCRNADIRNCFIRTYDDCITLKLRHNVADDGPYTDLQDIRVSGNLIWNDYARGIVVGPECGNQELGTGYIHDIEIEGCIFLQHKRGHFTDDLRAAFAIGQMSSPDGGTPERIENITARNLVFDNISKTGRNVWLYQYPSSGTTSMKDIILEDLTILDGEGVITPAIKLSAGYGNISNLHLRNIRFNGSRILEEGDELEVEGDVRFDIE